MPDGFDVAFIDIADAPSEALAAELGASVRYWRCDVREVDALQSTIGAAAFRRSACLSTTPRATIAIGWRT